MSKYCSNCGERANDEDRFCHYCGERIEEEDAGRGTRHDRRGTDEDREAYGDTGPTADNWEERAGRERRAEEWGDGERERSTDHGRDDSWSDEGRDDSSAGESHTRTGTHTRSGTHTRTGKGRKQGVYLPRKDAISTVVESFKWLLGFPILIGAFLVVDLIDTAGLVFGPVQLVSAILSLVVGGVAYIYVERIVRNQQPVDFGAAVGEVLGQLLSLIGIFVIYIVAVGVGFLLLILPGIYLGARLVLAFPACVLDKQDAFESLSTSWDVAHGNVMKLVGIFLISMLAALSIFIVGGVAGGIETLDNPILYLLAAPVSALITGTVEMAIARVYLENR